ncbi:hypothetical protein D3C87_1753980 [compost metagenome]
MKACLGAQQAAIRRGKYEFVSACYAFICPGKNAGRAGDIQRLDPIKGDQDDTAGRF